MAKLTADDVRKALGAVQEPDLGADLVTLDLVRDLSVADGDVSLRIALTSPATPHKELLRTQVLAALDALPGIGSIALRLEADPPDSATKLNKIRHIIGVGAGKGGVGKSTVAVNLSVALAQAGAKVGLLDADEPSAHYIRLDEATSGLTAPLHPGAARFYRDMGKLADPAQRR